MNEQKTIRPTKKQKQTLQFIDEFIKTHGYSPSYREIMTGCNYTSVATVALHVNNLIKRGHLNKREHSARSLEVVTQTDEPKIKSSQVNEAQEKWLVEKVDFYFQNAEQQSGVSANELDQLYVLVGSLKVLGLEGAASSFMPRLKKLKDSSRAK
jgi:repressor LexA